MADVTQVKRRPRGPAPDTRDRAIAGTLECLRALGREGTTVAAVSRASGLSRPTIYAHFETLDELVHQAVEGAAVDLSHRIEREIAGAGTPAETIVEYVVAAHREFKADPVVAMVVEVTLLPDLAAHGTISPQMIALSRRSMGHALSSVPGAADRLDEIIETLVRFVLSVLTYESANTKDDATLRAYLHRVLVPALGLPPVEAP